MTGHGWAQPNDADGEAIGAPIELHDVNVRSVTVDGGMAFDALATTHQVVIVAHDPHGAPLDLEGGTAPNQYSDLFESDDVVMFDAIWSAETDACHPDWQPGPYRQP